MPYKMLYKASETQTVYDVLVYHIQTDFDTLETLALCWVESKEYWITVPMFMLTPHKTKKTLKENKS